MFAYEVVERIDRTCTPVAAFKASWAAGLPIFHDLAKAYFARGARDTRRALLLYATIEDDARADLTALVCTARRVEGDLGYGVEIVAGPLLELAARRSRH